MVDIVMVYVNAWYELVLTGSYFLIGNLLVGWHYQTDISHQELGVKIDQVATTLREFSHGNFRTSCHLQM